jgi:DNA topoisomerase-1
VKRKKSLIIVESPAKARTLKKFLGDSYEIKASLGHVKDLPEDQLGVEIEKNFTPVYQIIPGKGKILQELKKAAKQTDQVYLAPDPDREGEAIAWHVSQELKEVPEEFKYRILLNEITEKAVKEALKNPGRIDQNKVDAQQARRILDRLVGYKLSPLLWEKVRRGLSAGRVQSVALRLICDREKDILAFTPEEYWTITATFEGNTPPSFPAKLFKVKGKKTDLKNQEQAEEIVRELRSHSFVVSQVEKKEKKRNPVAPFITSTLQQEAVRKLRFSPQKTMAIAQGLYEGLELGAEGSTGLITYMRTDSPRISAEAQDQAREYIKKRFGAEYLPAKAPKYKGKAAAQEAHEAIRPTSVFRDPETLKPYLSPDHFALYQLIWQRFLASQMTPAIYDITTVDITADSYLFRANGSIIRFLGFMKVYVEDKDELAEDPSEEHEKEILLPPLNVGETVNLLELTPKQHFTQPPPRYTAATLIKELEDKGIGRPSTYATILTVIKARDYVREEKGRFFPTDLGLLINELLVKNFPEILNPQFTAQLEDQLDQIEEGKANWTQTLADFYRPFALDLEKAQRNMQKIKAIGIPTEITCPQCGHKMAIKWGRNGEFLACSGYPQCKFTSSFIRDEKGKIKLISQEKIEAEPTEEQCSKCGQPMVIKNGKFGKFLACSDYPKCKNTKRLSSDSKIDLNCPIKGCSGTLTLRRTKRGKIFYGCSQFPQCTFATWDRPIPETCPECQAPFLVEKKNRHRDVTIECLREDCKYKREEKVAK